MPLIIAVGAALIGKQAKFPWISLIDIILRRREEHSVPRAVDSSPSTQKVGKELSGKRRFARHILPWLVVGFLAVAIIIIALGAHYAQPYVHARMVELLQQKFHGEVEVEDFHVSISPVLRVSGTGLVVRYKGRKDVPPLLAAQKFSTEANVLSFIGFWGTPWKIDRIHFKGLIIHIPPHEQTNDEQNQNTETSQEHKRRLKEIRILVRELDADDAELHIIPKDPTKPEHIFIIHQLVMYKVGLHHAASFTAHLTNYKPPGEIASNGNFGPWDANDPGQTPLAADYTFKNADLGVFKGISGTLTSEGKFGGMLEQLSVSGETDTPNFQVTLAGHPVDLKTVYEATVDGTNGNTMLHPVRANVGNTTIVANGAILKRDGEKGRSVELDVTVDGGRIEDLMRLAVKSGEPPLTGDVDLHTQFDLPAGEGDVIEKLKLQGEFGLKHALFTNASLKEKVQSLSRRGEGKPEDEDAGSSISNLRGQFALGGGIMTFRNLVFEVPGAHVQLNGTYALTDEKLDFYGTLKLQAKLSQMTTGYKSFLLKAVDPFFRKGDETVLPIKISGTREHPSFGLDLHHKAEKEAESKAQK
jgi:hypothetical protein